MTAGDRSFPSVLARTWHATRMQTTGTSLLGSRKPSVSSMLRVTDVSDRRAGLLYAAAVQPHPVLGLPTPPPNPIDAKIGDRAGSVASRHSRSRRDAAGALDRFRPIPSSNGGLGGGHVPSSLVIVTARCPGGARFPRAGAGTILPRPGRTQGGGKAGAASP